MSNKSTWMKAEQKALALAPLPIPPDTAATLREDTHPDFVSSCPPILPNPCERTAVVKPTPRA
jgi:hypothetical protein